MLGDSDDSQRAPLNVRLLRVFASPPEISRIEGECARRVAHSKRLRDTVGPRLLGGLRSPAVGLCRRGVTQTPRGVVLSTCCRRRPNSFLGKSLIAEKQYQDQIILA